MVTGTVTAPHGAVNVTLIVPADFLDLSVNTAVPRREILCDPPGLTCRSDDLLEVPVTVVANDE